MADLPNPSPRLNQRVDSTKCHKTRIEYIKTISSGNGILASDSIVEGHVKDIVSYTPSYSHRERMKVIQKNIRPLNHPYYTEYTALQKLCVQILRQEEIKYGSDDDRIYGILFDGSWLWEEYLNTLLQDLNFTHPENRLGTGAIYLFEHGGQRFPDFWRSDFVLDAKYKRLAQNDNRLDIERDDVHQVIAYMYRLKALKGGVVCPLNADSNKIVTQDLHSQSYQGTMSIYAIAIPHGATSYDNFVKDIINNENLMLKEIS